MLSIAIVSRKFLRYEKLFNDCKSLHQHYHLIFAGDTPNNTVFEQAEVIIGNPNIGATYVDKCKSLKWFQSTWAGNNSLQNNKTRGYQLTSVKGIFAQQMSEYVMAYLLYFARNIETFNQLKAQQRWFPASRYSLQGKTMGIMGLGNIGQAVAVAAQAFNIKVIGLAQSPKSIKNVRCFLPAQLSEFTAQCDVIVNLLPDTKETTGLVDAKFFEYVKPGTIFINAGRGTVVASPECIINAIDEGILKAAVLDVFEQEPLEPDHPFYQTKNVYISCHTAAQSEPEEAFGVFLHNAQRLANKQNLEYLHDFEKGY